MENKLFRVEDLEIHILNNEDDWGRNPQSMMRDFVDRNSFSPIIVDEEWQLTEKEIEETFECNIDDAKGFVARTTQVIILDKVAPVVSGLREAIRLLVERRDELKVDNEKLKNGINELLKIYVYDINPETGEPKMDLKTLMESIEKIKKIAND